MIAGVMRAKAYLPQPLWRMLCDGYWRWQWLAERIGESIKEKRLVPPIRNSERAFLIEHILNCYPFETALEVGCGYGQNFHVVAKKLPRVSFIGVDRDKERIEAGAEILRQRGISNVVLEVANAKSLEKYRDSSIEIVYTCASLLLVEPESLEVVLRELIRISSRRVLLMEQHVDARSSSSGSAMFEVPRPSQLGGKYWVRDYREALERIVAKELVTVTPVPEPRWEIESWKKTACLIEVDCSKGPV